MNIDPASLDPAKRYYLMTSCIIPRPIAWVSTVNDDGSFNLAPFSFFNGLSSTPPLVAIGFGPHPEKPEKDTLHNIKRSSEMNITIPEFNQVAQVEATGESLPYGEPEFVYAGLSPLTNDTTGAPRVAGAKISMECVLDQLISTGDDGGAIVIAEVKMFHIDEAILDERNCVDPAKFPALARITAGRYAAVGDAFKVE